MKNQEIAEIFFKMADILEILNIDWKPQAYRKAAQSLQVLNKDVEIIYKEKGLKGLDEIPFIGGGLSKKIEEYIKTKKINEYDILKKKIPKGLESLMDVIGLGPKRIKVLYQKLKVKNLGDLKKALEKHKIETLEGFGEKSEENIKKGLEFMTQSKKRLLLGEVYPIAQEIISYLKKTKDTKSVEIAGSLRRMKETIGDIDILATSSNKKNIISEFLKFPDIKRVLAKGETKATVLLKNNIQCDLRVVKDDEFGSALQYFTGDKQHNIELRKIAIKKGYKLNEYGLFKNEKKIAGKTEEEIYNKLGFSYIPPEIRINEGELTKKIPKLIDYKDIKGDLHIHTKDSDGWNSIKEMVLKAKSLNYEYIVITNHSASRKISHGLNEKRLLEFIKKIKDIKIKDIKVLAGAEVDILENGEMDYNDSLLKKLDFVIAGIHSGFNNTKEKMTSRIISALENENVNLIAHPTGRLVNQREPYKIDFEKICKVCSKNKKFLEINSQPKRLDLNYENIKLALKHDIKLCVDTDSHNVNDMDYIRYGIAQARKGWCTKKSVINTLSLKEFLKEIR